MTIIVVMVLMIVLLFTRIVPLVVLDVLMFCHTLEVCLELAVTLLSGERTELHIDVTPRHTRFLIAVPHGDQIFFDLLRQLMTQFLMRHLTTTKLELNPHLMALSEEVFRVDDLDHVVMRIDADAELHFLYPARLVVLVSFLFVLLLQILVLAVVDDFADWRIGVRRDLYKVKATFFGHPNGLRRRKDSELNLTFLDNDSHLRCPNSLIDASLVRVATAIVAVTVVIPPRTVSSWATRSARTTGWPRWSCRTSNTCCGSPSGPYTSSCWTRRWPRRPWSRLGTLIVLLRPWRTELAAAQVLEWVANRIPPGVLSVPGRRIPAGKCFEYGMPVLSYLHRPARDMRSTFDARTCGIVWCWVKKVMQGKIGSVANDAFGSIRCSA